MNLQFKFTILLVTLLAVFSCKKKESEQIELQPDEMVGAFVDTDFQFEGASVLKDSTLAGNSSVNSALIGILKNNTYGEFSSSYYTEIKIPDNSFDIDSNAQFVSANLTLTKNYHYGNTSKKIEVLVYQLAENLNRNADYFVTQNAKIGEYLQEIEINPEENEFTIPLNQVFTTKIRNLENKIINQDDLNDLFKGLAFLPTEGSSLIGFDLDNSSITLEYFIPDSTGGETINKIFLLGSGEGHFNKISSDRSGTPFENINSFNELVEVQSTQNKVLIQSSSRIEGVITSPNLNDKLYNTKQFIYRANFEIETNQLGENMLNENQTVLAAFYNSNDSLVSITSTQVRENKINFDFTEASQAISAGSYEFGYLEIYTSIVASRGYTFWIEDPSENINLKVYIKEE